MPGGVGGVQSIMAAPYPDFLVTDLTLPQSHWADVQVDLRPEPRLFAAGCRGFLLDWVASEGQAVMDGHGGQHGKADGDDEVSE